MNFKSIIEESFGGFSISSGSEVKHHMDPQRIKHGDRVRHKTENVEGTYHYQKQSGDHLVHWDGDSGPHNTSRSDFELSHSKPKLEANDN